MLLSAKMHPRLPNARCSVYPLSSLRPASSRELCNLFPCVALVGETISRTLIAARRHSRLREGDVENSNHQSG